jgi:hypothetical protein
LDTTDTIVQDVAFEQFAENKIKLLTFLANEDGSYTYTFSEFNSRDFVDWGTWDSYINGAGNTGADYTSVIQTGWQDFKAPLNQKKISHLTSFFNRTETGYTLDGSGNIVYDYPSGAQVQTRWEWSDYDVGRWTTAEDAYRLLRFYIPEDELDPFNYGFEVIKTRLRMRGKGHAFSVRYTSVPGTDMQLLGFAVNIIGGSKV